MTNKINVKLRSDRTLVAKPSKQRRVLINQSNLRELKNSIAALGDVDMTSKTDGSVLVYDATEEVFKASTVLEKQIINGGHY